jgi:GT2 family glycosyltransferase
MESPKVFVVILNKDGKDCLPECLRGVFGLTYPNFEVVVIDNASRDGSMEAARRDFGRVHFILNEENVGFAAGMNVGIRYARSRGAQYVWILNNDAAPGRDALTELVRVAERESDAILSPLVLSPSGKTWFAGGRIDWIRMRAIHVDPPVDTHTNEPYETGYLSGCALFLPKKAIETIGLFDEDYFLYYEDADYSVRAHEAGFQTLVVPKSVVVHGEQSETHPEKVYWLVRSGLRFFRTHATWWQRPYLTCYIALRKLKNRNNLKQSSEEARLVAQAYADEKEKTRKS